MASDTRSTRLNRSTTAITALAAVLSVSGVAAATSGPTHHEARSGLSDTQVVRVFAAMVEAMARDLLAPGDCLAAFVESPTGFSADQATASAIAFEHDERGFVTPLLTRHLDLPPPTC